MEGIGRRKAIIATLYTGLLTACGAGGESAPPVASPPPDSPPAPPFAPVVTLTYGVKLLQFAWSPVPGATHYQLLERAEPGGTFVQVGIDLTTTSVNHEIALHRRLNAVYQVNACNDLGCTSSTEIALAGNLAPAIGYFKASNAEAGDLFSAVAVSADGNTLIVGAPGEGSNATGINGDQTDNSSPSAGAVYVFVRSSAGTWTQQAYVKASNTDSTDVFGIAVALSGDGNTFAVGATGESSNATGVNGNQMNNSVSASGAVYVFARTAGGWGQEAYIKASNTDQFDRFGSELALSANGTTLAVGSSGEDSNATGINGNEADNSANSAGAVYVFTRTASTWSQQAYIKASNTDADDLFGFSLALSLDGNTLAVGALGEDSNATGVNGNQADNSANGAGAVYTFTLAAGVWSQQAYVKASNTESDDLFGSSVALSGDGHTLAVGAMFEDSNATGVNGNQADNSAGQSGAVYVFTSSAGTWSQQAYVKASNTGANDAFGSAIELSHGGVTMAVGAVFGITSGESSSAVGVGGNQADNSAANAGAVYVFTRAAGAWSQHAYVKASNTEVRDGFGGSLAMSGGGGVLAVGARFEDSNATGIGGNQANNLAAEAGAVYLY